MSTQNDPSKDKDDAASRLLDGLNKRRTVVLHGKITDELIGNLGRQLLLLQIDSSEPINMIIDSGGGSTIPALQLCDMMKAMLKAPVHGIALGSCGSAATLVMLHCSKRVSTPYSRFLIHSGTFSQISVPINQTTSDHLKQLLKEAESADESVLKIYEKYLTPKTWTEATSAAEKREYVKQLIGRGDQRFDSWLLAEEAVECGLIESIVTENLDIF